MDGLGRKRYGETVGGGDMRIVTGVLERLAALENQRRGYPLCTVCACVSATKRRCQISGCPVAVTSVEVYYSSVSELLFTLVFS